MGMSVEALASAWARQEDAPHGSVVVVANEVSGRLRGGTPWRAAEPEALMMAMVVRPQITPLQEALLWLAVSIAAAEAANEVSTADHALIWPDTLVRIDDGIRCGSMNVTAQLGPGCVDHAVLSVRALLEEIAVEKETFLAALTSQLLRAITELETQPLVLVDSFTDRCSVVDQLVKATLLPRGEARGRVVAIDPEGFLVLETTTGMLERIAPATLRSLETV